MKTLATWALLAGSGLIGGLVLTGCTATPALSGDERAAQDMRNINFDLEALGDETDQLLLLRPSDTLTQWNVIHRD